MWEEAGGQSWGSVQGRLGDQGLEADASRLGLLLQGHEYALFRGAAPAAEPPQVREAPAAVLSAAALSAHHATPHAAAGTILAWAISASPTQLENSPGAFCLAITTSYPTMNTRLP